MRREKARANPEDCTTDEVPEADQYQTKGKTQTKYPNAVKGRTTEKYKTDNVPERSDEVPAVGRVRVENQYILCLKPKAIPAPQGTRTKCQSVATKCPPQVVDARRSLPGCRVRVGI